MPETTADNSNVTASTRNSGAHATMLALSQLKQISPPKNSVKPDYLLILLPVFLCACGDWTTHEVIDVGPVSSMGHTDDGHVDACFGAETIRETANREQWPLLDQRRAVNYYGASRTIRKRYDGHAYRCNLYLYIDRLKQWTRWIFKNSLTYCAAPASASANAVGAEQPVEIFHSESMRRTA